MLWLGPWSQHHKVVVVRTPGWCCGWDPWVYPSVIRLLWPGPLGDVVAGTPGWCCGPPEWCCGWDPWVMLWLGCWVLRVSSVPCLWCHEAAVSHWSDGRLVLDEPSLRATRQRKHSHVPGWPPRTTAAYWRQGARGSTPPNTEIYGSWGKNKAREKILCYCPTNEL